MIEEIEITDTESEWAMVGVIMARGSVPVECLSVEAKELTVPDVRDAFEAILDAHNSGLRIDTATVKKKIGNERYATFSPKSKQAFQSTDMIGNYVHRIHETYIKRQVVKMCLSVSRTAHDKDSSSVDVLNMMKHSDLDIKSSREAANIEPLIRDMLANLHTEKKKGKKDVIATGIRAIDELCGGLMSGCVCVVGADNSTGKSALALNLAISTSRLGNKVMYCSLEDTARFIAMRAASNFSGIELERFIHKTATEHEERIALETVETLPFFIDDRSRQSAQYIRNAAIRHQQRYGLDLLIIDHLGKMKKGFNPLVETSNASREISEIAKELDCAVVLLCQLNRKKNDVEKQRPKKEHLRDSGEIEDDARMIWLLYRDIKNDPYTLELEVVKNSHGRVGETKLDCNLAKMQVW